MDKYKPHEIANIFPLLSGKDFCDLKEDIKKSGLLEPIVLFEGRILDGRNRFRACQEVGVEPRFREYEGSDPIGFVLSLNLVRRHLTSDQRAAAAVDALPLFEAEAKKRQIRKPVQDDSVREKIPQQKDEMKSRNQVAKKFDTNGRYVSDLKKIKADDPETFDAIKSGERRLSEVKKVLKRKERIEKISEISNNNSELTTNKLYPVIYADPPWRYEYTKADSRAIENQYPTMSLDEIRKLAIPSAADCVLFMWTTAPKLEDGLSVLKAWGFEYRSCAIWDKQKMGMGYYFRIQHEILLIGTKGNIPTPEPENRPRSVISVAYQSHSAKPKEFSDIIEAMYPELPKIELFCRTPQPGWDVWGNESGS